MIHDINNPTVKREGGGKRGKKPLIKEPLVPILLETKLVAIPLC